ncbi:MAG TPA: YdbL family protein [Sphingomicrobium sp.]|nr:YdbL family protein [Sphingomicrobium sp.]
MRIGLGVAAALAATASAGLAQSSQLSAAIASGQVGERYDGYMGFASPPPDALRREVIGINIRRRSLYTGLAEQRGVTTQLVGLTAACALFRELPSGEAYMLADNRWRRRTAGGTAPLPEHCR